MIPHQTPHRRRQRGFTLIELAIVLVIIAILLGSILTTQSLIQSARVQDTIAIASDLSQATRDFRTKFGALPGDHPRATTQVAGATVDGNGDGEIGTAAETAAATDHLNRAGMIRPPDAAGQMLSRYGLVRLMSTGFAFASCNAGGVNLDFTGIPVTLRNWVVLSTLPSEVAAEIDRKLDDGVFNTGRIRGTSAYTGAGALAQVLCLAIPL